MAPSDPTPDPTIDGQATFDELLPTPAAATDTAPTGGPQGTDGATGAADQILTAARELFRQLENLDVDARIDTINALRLALHEHSPMRDQPVDCVQWVPADQVAGNKYNPNVVASPEMDLLTLSIQADGYTQPVVAWQTEPASYEVVDGFHRHRVGKEDGQVRAAIHGRLPVTVANTSRTDKPDRMASTIRHNRARGQHTVEGMSEIVVELARRRKPDEWIGEHLGMDPDEVRRLRQTTGLGIAQLYAEAEFNEAWDIDT